MAKCISVFRNVIPPFACVLPTSLLEGELYIHPTLFPLVKQEVMARYFYEGDI